MINIKQKEAPDISFKLLLLGNNGVGKSCIFLRYFDDIFNISQLTTIGVDYRIKRVSYQDKKIQLIIWDTAGQDRFKSITQSYYKGADGIILIYDVMDVSSFQDIRQWLIQIKEHAPQSCKIILVGNKIDITNRVVTKEEGEKLANENNISFIETSSKENINITELFAKLYTELCDYYYLDEDRLKERLSRNEKKRIIEQQSEVENESDSNSKSKCC